MVAWHCSTTPALPHPSARCATHQAALRIGNCVVGQERQRKVVLRPRPRSCKARGAARVAYMVARAAHAGMIAGELSTVDQRKAHDQQQLGVDGRLEFRQVLHGRLQPPPE